MRLKHIIKILRTGLNLRTGKQGQAPRGTKHAGALVRA